MMPRLLAAVVAGLVAVMLVPSASASADKGVGTHRRIVIQVPNRVPLTSPGCASFRVKARVVAVDVGSYWSVAYATKPRKGQWLSQGFSLGSGTGLASTERWTVSVCGIPSLSPFGRYRVRAVLSVGEDVSHMTRRDVAYARTKIVRS